MAAENPSEWTALAETMNKARDLVASLTNEALASARKFKECAELGLKYQKAGIAAVARVKDLEKENASIRRSHDAIALKYDILRGVRDENGMRI